MSAMGLVHAWMSMSLDGCIAGPNDRPGNPLGDGGERLHEWFFDADGPDAEIAAGPLARSRAVVIGRRMFDHGVEPWGDDGAFGMPVFVVTHRAHGPVVKGPTTFSFVTKGVERAVHRAVEAASGEPVAVAGGAQTVMQCLRMGLLDELRIDLVPTFLGGDCVPLFDGAAFDGVQLHPIDVVGSPSVTHIRYRVDR